MVHRKPDVMSQDSITSRTKPAGGTIKELGRCYEAAEAIQEAQQTHRASHGSASAPAHTR